MTVPGIVQSTLEGEEIATRVALGGDDELFITPSKTIIYRADGLLSDESVDSFPHDADRLTLSEGRRKTRFTLEYPLEGTREFTIPSKRTDDVLHPVLAGVLNGNGITEPGETVLQTFRFSELTVILTSHRLVKHIGEAVWDGDFEQYAYEAVTNLSFEPGSVATQIVLETDGRQQRFKTPNDRAGEVRERLERALFAYYDVDSLEELNATVAEDDGDAEPAEEPHSSVDFGVGVDPLDANPPELDSDGAIADDQADASQSPPAESAAVQADTPNGRSGSSDPLGDTKNGTRTGSPTGASDVGEDPFESNTLEAVDESQGSTESSPPTPQTDPELLERIEALEETVSKQTEQIAAQQETIEQLIEELRRGR
ncbi:hypothetical protein OB919_05925 [Halobacteria archaeon AArc-curdl1]|uniref:DUF7115 domain-containing protein n=1 Tax=Natronosalvus hydrolyticus TaxID=2979988 RepID=A0AAP2Z6U8_9EURY|nr:hypothetical protein [Halobacteria archaeon AArc-curdl1]